MKKLLVVLMVLVMSISLAGCGGEDVPAANPSNEVPKDKVAQEQALVDADYEQLKDLLAGLDGHNQKDQQLSALREQVRNGQAKESALLDAVKQMSDHSQALLQKIKSTQWKTEHYKKHVSLLTASVEALAQAEKLVYEAGVANDESKINTVADLMTEYNTKLEELLDLMGV